MSVNMEVHDPDTMYPSRVYPYVTDLLRINPKMPIRELCKKISFYKDISMPAMSTVASWKAHPERLYGYYLRALEREKKQKEGDIHVQESQNPHSGLGKRRKPQKKLPGN